MPIYEYQCKACSEQFELLMLRSTVAACPSCGSQDIDQLLSGFAVSSDSIRQSNARAARRASVQNSNYKDQQVAEAEYVKKHND